MKQYKHSIARSKLEKKGLSDKQIEKIYSKKGAKAQTKAFNSMLRGNATKLTYSDFWTKPLGIYILRKQLTLLRNLRESTKWDTLSPKQRNHYEHKFYQAQLRLDIAKSKITKDDKVKADMLASLKHRKEMRTGRRKARKQVDFINPNSYDKNHTTNVLIEKYIVEHYQDELSEMMQSGEYTFQQAIDTLIDKAIAEGNLKPLMQGVGYGYIDEDFKEVISPV